MLMPRGSLFAPQTAFGEAAEQTAWFMDHGNCVVAEKGIGEGGNIEISGCGGASPLLPISMIDI
jgi:hypothetical protein